MGASASVGDARLADEEKLYWEVAGDAEAASRTVTFPEEGLSFVARADEVEPALPGGAWSSAVSLEELEAPVLGSEYTLACWVKLPTSEAIAPLERSWTTLFSGMAGEIILGHAKHPGESLGVLAKGVAKANIALRSKSPWGASTPIDEGVLHEPLNVATGAWALIVVTGRSRRKCASDLFVASDRHQLRRVGRVAVSCTGSRVGALGGDGVQLSRAYIWKNRCLSHSEMRAVFICGAADHGALSTSEGLGVQFGGYWAPMKSASEEAKLAAAAPREGVLDLTGTGVSDDELVAILANAQLGAVGGVHTLILSGCPISDRGVRIALLPLLDEARYLRCVDVTGCAHIGATVEAELLADFPVDRGVMMLAAGTALSIRAVEHLMNDTYAAHRAQAALALKLTLAAATDAAVVACTGAARAAADTAAAATRAAQRVSLFYLPLYFVRILLTICCCPPPHISTTRHRAARGSARVTLLLRRRASLPQPPPPRTHFGGR